MSYKASVQAVAWKLHGKFFLSTYQQSVHCNKMKNIAEWRFSTPNLLRNFPVDPITENYVRKTPGFVFSAVKPTPLRTKIQLVAASDDALTKILDMDPSVKLDPKFLNFVSGNELLQNSDPLSHRYGGYQFGYWADQLGDGRAITLGQYVNRYLFYIWLLFNIWKIFVIYSEGKIWELQLKGAGKTPYSRFGDGRAVLRSSIREFLCSETMHALGKIYIIISSHNLKIHEKCYIIYLFIQVSRRHELPQ